MFRSIKDKYPQSSFKIFGKKNNLLPELKQQLDLLYPQVEFNDRVSQQELTTHLLQSDVWLYPNNFEETYCISAVEAAAAGCLICCNTHAGLLTTVADRGAVIQGRYDKEKLLDRLYSVLEDRQQKNALIQKGFNYASTQDFDKVTDRFISTFLSI